MEELLELKNLILKGESAAALLLVEELEEMSRDDKINNIRSHAKVLLHHLIKKQAENRSTKSWEVSIRNSVREIKEKNKRRKSGGYYLTKDDLQSILRSALDSAIDTASLEVSQGKYEPEELAALIDSSKLLNDALLLIVED